MNDRAASWRGRLVPAPVIAWLDHRHARAQLAAERAELLADPDFTESLRQYRAGESGPALTEDEEDPRG